MYNQYVSFLYASKKWMNTIYEKWRPVLSSTLMQEWYEFVRTMFPLIQFGICTVGNNFLNTTKILYSFFSISHTFCNVYRRCWNITNICSYSMSQTTVVSTKLHSIFFSWWLFHGNSVLSSCLSIFMCHILLEKQ